MGGTSWKPVVILPRPVRCDPKNMPSTRSELSGILACMNNLSWVNSMLKIMLKVTLQMCCNIKATLEVLQKWLCYHTTHKMWKKPNADIINETKHVLKLLPIVTLKLN